MMVKHLGQEAGLPHEAELLELNALCSVLPGPSSTQTITAYRLQGGRAQPGLPEPDRVGVALPSPS
jgi:chromate transporter